MQETGYPEFQWASNLSFHLASWQVLPFPPHKNAISQLCTHNHLQKITAANMSSEKNFRWDLSYDHFYTRLPLLSSAWTFGSKHGYLKKRNALFHPNLTTVLYILFQGICIPQRINRNGCFQLYVIGSNMTQVSKDKHLGKHVAQSNMGNVKNNVLWTNRDNLYDLIRHTLTDLAPLQRISAAEKRPFTFASLQAVPAQSPEDKDNFPVFWLVTNDPPDLCRGNVTSSCYNSNLQLIGNCIIACITRRVFTFNFFLLSLWFILCAYICASTFLSWLHTEKGSCVTADANSNRYFPWNGNDRITSYHALDQIKQEVFQIQ